MDFSNRCRTCLRTQDQQHILTNITKKCYSTQTFKEVLLKLVPDIVGSVSNNDCICATCEETLTRSAGLIDKCLTIEANLKRCKNNVTDLHAKNLTTNIQPKTETNYVHFIFNDNNSVTSPGKPIILPKIFLSNIANIPIRVEKPITTVKIPPKSCGEDCPSYDHSYCVTETSNRPVSSNLMNISIPSVKSHPNRILTLEPNKTTDLTSFVTCLTRNNVNITDISTNVDNRRKRVLLIGTDVPTKCNKCRKSIKYEKNHVCSEGTRKKKKKMVVCPKCGKTRQSSYMKIHLQKHARDEMRQAKMEKMEEMRKQALRTCGTCSERFPTDEEFAFHLQIHPPFVCEQCGKGFAKKESLHAHKKTHNDPNSYICEVCGKGYKDANSLRHHLQLHSNKTYKCSLCPKTFKQKIRVYRHVKQVHDKAYNSQCTLCGKLFTGNWMMKSHMSLVHSKEKPYECTICQKKFGRADYLRNHMSCHTGERKSQSQSQNYKTRPRKIRYKIQDNGEPLPCKFCGNWYKGIIRLKRHLETHVKRYPCQYCPLTFGRKALMQRHAKIHEGGNVNFYRCNVCWKRFLTKDGLDEHIICHDNPRYSCEVCGKLFNRRFLMNHHMLLDHKHITEEKEPDEVIFNSLLQVCSETSLIQPDN